MTGLPDPRTRAPRILPLTDPSAIPLAAGLLRRGALIAFPTDTVYGVGGDALSREVAARTYEAKGRPAGKGFPVLLAHTEDARRLAAAWPAPAALLAARFWPGALTLVVPAMSSVPDETRTGETVALRVPGLAALRQLIAAAGCPLIGTSANRSGEPPATSAAAAALALRGAVEVVLDGGTTGGQPSTVVVVEETRVRIVRGGAIDGDALQAVLAPAGCALVPATG